MASYKLWFWLSCFILFSLSCKKERVDKKYLPLRTTIVYMIADNNLDYFADQDINEMEQGWRNEIDGNLIVYIDRPAGASPSHPVVYKISYDTTKNINSKIVKVYEEHDATNASTMTNVLSDLVKLYPAQEYGLILWSHGTGWLPAGTEIKDNQEKSLFSINGRQLPLTKSFGKDGTNELDIGKLKGCLPIHFDFIIFDACFMASVEVMYELRNNTNYILASPTQILSTGYPYNIIVPYLFNKHVDYEKIASSFFDFYNNQTGVMKSASITVIRTAFLENLSKEVAKNITNPNILKADSYSLLQQFTISKSNLLFDLSEFISLLTTNENNIKSFKKALNDVIVFKNNTPKIVESLSLNNCSGLSIFIPSKETSQYFKFYKKYEWYNQSNYNYYFDNYSFN